MYTVWFYQLYDVLFSSIFCQEKPTFASFEVEDSAMKTASVDYQTDSQEMLKHISDKQMDTNDEETNQSGASVDENCQIKNMG